MYALFLNDLKAQRIDTTKMPWEVKAGTINFITETKPYHMFKNYFKTAWRNIIKNKTYSVINVLGLATGMAVAMIIGLWIYDEVSANKITKITIRSTR